jgi:hypothetical protein
VYTRLRNSGTLTYTRNCPGTTQTCSGTWNNIDYREDITRGGPDPVTCVYPAHATTVIRNINDTRACALFAGIVNRIASVRSRARPPGFETVCAGLHTRDTDCNGQPQFRETWDWDFNHSCFSGSIKHDYTNSGTIIDGGLCASPTCSMGVQPGACIGAKCYEDRQLETLTFSIRITSTEECSGPWSAIRQNTANGCSSTNAGGVWEGWYALLDALESGGASLMSEGPGDPVEFM